MKMLKFNSEDSLYFISDPHFNHINMALTWRGFKSVDDMNSTIIENWQNTVTDDDYIFILGDFYWGDYKEWPETIKRLPGKKILILGNHDYKYYDEKLSHLFEMVVDRCVIMVGDRKITLDHYPMVQWDGSQRGSWQFYGHIHDTGNKYETDNQFCVCCELIDYTPISFTEISEHIINKSKPYRI